MNSCSIFSSFGFASVVATMARLPCTGARGATPHWTYIAADFGGAQVHDRDLTSWAPSVLPPSRPKQRLFSSTTTWNGTGPRRCGRACARLMQAPRRPIPNRHPRCRCATLLFPKLSSSDEDPLGRPLWQLATGDWQEERAGGEERLSYLWCVGACRRGSGTSAGIRSYART